MERVLLFITAGLVFLLIGVFIERQRRANASPPPARSPASTVPADLAALDDTTFRSRLVQEIDAGRTIEAIKWVRARTGLGLKEAKDVVDALAAGEAGVVLERREAENGALDDAEFNARLIVEIAAGNKIEAIKLYRERTGLGLKEAKDAIEALGRGA
jgi:ribosomal protein L7/L12